MDKTTLVVPRINCGHCVMTIKRELEELEGIKKVEGDSVSKQVRIEWDTPATLEQIKSILKEINYPAE